MEICMGEKKTRTNLSRFFNAFPRTIAIGTRADYVWKIIRRTSVYAAIMDAAV